MLFQIGHDLGFPDWLTVINAILILMVWAVGIAYLIYEWYYLEMEAFFFGFITVVISLVPAFGWIIGAVLVTIFHVESDTGFFEDVIEWLIDLFTKNNILAKIGVKRVPIVLWPIVVILPFLKIIYLGFKYIFIGVWKFFLFIAEYIFGFYLCQECKRFYWINVKKVKKNNKIHCEFCEVADTLAP